MHGELGFSRGISERFVYFKRLRYIHRQGNTQWCWILGSGISLTDLIIRRAGNVIRRYRVRQVGLVESREPHSVAQYQNLFFSICGGISAFLDRWSDAENKLHCIALAQSEWSVFETDEKQ